MSQQAYYNYKEDASTCSEAATEPVSTPSPYKQRDEEEESEEDTAVNDMKVLYPSFVATWVNMMGETRRLSNIDSSMFEIHVEAASRAALFKIRVPVAVDGGLRKTNVFLFVYPEHIRVLSLDTTQDDGEAATLARQLLRTETVCLRFVLHRPPTLVVPKLGGQLDDMNENASKVALEGLRSLATNTYSFAIHAPANVTPRQRLVQLCQAFSAKPFITLRRLANIPTLYGGKGGNIYEAEVAEEDDEKNPPPSYHDTHMTPRGHGVTNSKKRCRISSSPASAINDPGEYQQMEKPASATSSFAQMDQVARQIKDYLDQRFSLLEGRLDAIEQRLGRIEASSTQCQGHVVAETAMEERADDLRQEFQEQLEEAKSEILTQVDDGKYEVILEVKQYLHDEVLPELQDNVKVGVLDQFRVALDN